MTKSVNNLDDLVKLVGKEVVDKCFLEYVMLMIAKSKKLDEIENTDE